MLIVGAVLMVATQGGAAATDALLSGARSAVTLAFELAGAYLLFLGIVGIVKRVGLMDALSRKLAFVTRALFPRAGGAAASITLAIAANMLGLGNAATPFGLSAMQELEKLNPHPGTATDEMCTLLCVNASCIQLVPTSLIALRQAAGSVSAANIVLPCLAASVAAAVTAIALCKVLSKR